MSLDPTNGLYPPFKEYVRVFLDAVRKAGVSVRVTSGFRSRAEQDRLYRDYRMGRSKYPAAYPGTSLHEWGLAVDLSAALGPRALQVLGSVWEECGLGIWGGHFSDPIHFEASAEMKKQAGWSKGAPYEAPLEEAFNPLEGFIGTWWTSLIPLPKV